MDIKIENSRIQRRERQKYNRHNHMTPKKYICKQSKIRTMDRAEKKWGFDFDEDKCESKVLKWEKESFMDKLSKYYRGNDQGFVKKQSDREKHQRKVNLNLEIGHNRIKTALVNIDKILTGRMKSLLFLYASGKKKY